MTGRPVLSANPAGEARSAPIAGDADNAWIPTDPRPDQEAVFGRDIFKHLAKLGAKTLGRQPRRLSQQLVEILAPATRQHRVRPGFLAAGSADAAPAASGRAHRSRNWARPLEEPAYRKTASKRLRSKLGLPRTPGPCQTVYVAASDRASAARFQARGKGRHRRRPRLLGAIHASERARSVMPQHRDQQDDRNGNPDQPKQHPFSEAHGNVLHCAGARARPANNVRQTRSFHGNGREAARISAVRGNAFFGTEWPALSFLLASRRLPWTGIGLKEIGSR